MIEYFGFLQYVEADERGRIVTDRGYRVGDAEDARNMARALVAVADRLDSVKAVG